MNARALVVDRDPWWFQPRTIKSVEKHWQKGARSVCIVAPPGSGKTVMAADIAKRLFKRPVCVSHTRALKRNSVTRLCESFTIQECLWAGKIPGKETPDLVIWDECHHSAAETWGSVLDLVPRKTKVLGLTATPQRSDGKALDRFDELVVAATYTELLMAGTIVPFRVLYPDEFKDDAAPDMAAAYLKFGEGRKAIFYCRDVEHADTVTRDLKRQNIACEAWHSKSGTWKKRDEILKDFETSKLRALVTVDALVEGFDVPDSDCVVLGAKCIHVGTYLQRTGRGGRSSPGKSDCLLLDLVGAHLRHGPPIEDRMYTLDGTGIRRRGGRGGDWYYERGEREQSDVGSYTANLIVGYDWRAPTDAQKRQNLGYLIEYAGRAGWPEDAAVAMFRTVFGQEPPA